MPEFLRSLGFDKWQRRTANGLIHLLCGCGVLAGSRGSGKWDFPWSSAPACGRSLQSPGERERNHGLSQTWKSGLFMAQPGPDGARFRRFSRTGGSPRAPGGSPLRHLGAKPPPRTRAVKRALRVTSVDPKDPHDKDGQNAYTQTLFLRVNSERQRNNNALHSNVSVTFLSVCCGVSQL